MSLIRRTLLIITFTIVAGIFFLWFFLRVNAFRNYTSYELSLAYANAGVIHNLIDKEGEHLRYVAGIYAALGATYDLATKGDPGFLSVYVAPEVLQNNGLNFFAVLNSDRKLVAIRMLDNTSNAERTIPDTLRNYIQQSAILWDLTHSQDGAGGFAPLDNSALYLYARPIHNSLREGQVVGSVIVGMSLDHIMEDVEEAYTNSNLQVQFAPPTEMAALVEKINNQDVVGDTLEERELHAFEVISDDILRVSEILYGANGEAVAILRHDEQRTFFQQGLVIFRNLQVFLIGAGLVMGLLILTLLRQNVLKPVNQLIAQVNHVRASGNLALRVPVNRTKELGNLGISINELLASLEKAQAQLHENTDLMTAIIDSSPDFIIAKDAQYRYRLVNQGFAKVIGFSKSELLGKNDYEMGFPTELIEGNPDKGISGFRPDDEAVFLRGETRIIERDLVKIGAEMHTFYTTKKPLYNAQGERTGVLIYAHDITVVLKAQSERERLIRELQDALLFKDQFLATMSHELRTPLNAILGFSGIALIQYQGLPPQVTHILERIKSNSKRLLSLINDILDISRINAGRIELVHRPLHLEKMVRGWHDDFVQQAQDKNVKLNLEYDATLPESIIGDEERITQIAANLLNNAIKFTDQGAITIKTALLDQQWSFSVQDTGIGIPETWQHLIFEEFRQVDSSSRRKYGGAGLGLSIVAKLCQTMGGTVRLTSEPGVGSTFLITLPLRPAEPDLVIHKQPLLAV